MTTYYDDNFGCYEIENNDDVDFYFENQRKSILKTCQGCNRTLKLLPQYAYCNSCADKRERGWDF